MSERGSSIEKNKWTGKKVIQTDNLIKYISLSVDGCPNDCNAHGECIRYQETWKCECRNGWKGEACDLARETKCVDRVDNDQGDGKSHTGRFVFHVIINNNN